VKHISNNKTMGIPYMAGTKMQVAVKLAKTSLLDNKSLMIMILQSESIYMLRAACQAYLTQTTSRQPLSYIQNCIGCAHTITMQSIKVLMHVMHMFVRCTQVINKNKKILTPLDCHENWHRSY